MKRLRSTVDCIGSIARCEAMKRRRFLLTTGAAALATWRIPVPGAATQAPPVPEVRIRALTQGPKHHFFGYYGIPPWNRSGTRLLCLETEFQDHMPGPGETAAIGLVDAQAGRFDTLTDTRAWNFQQGAMLHWHPAAPDTEIVFNDLRQGEVASAVLNVQTGQRRWLPRPISALSHRGRHALSLTYGRLARLRKVTGYAGAVDPNPQSPAPENDGVFLMELATGQCRLVVSYARIQSQLLDQHPELKEQHLWIDHVEFNPADTRFLLLPRTWTRGPNPRLETGMFTANPDGSDLREVIPYGSRVSHFGWRNEREIIATFTFEGANRHVLFTDGKQDYRVLGRDVFKGDGHCTFSPDGEWLATDQNHTDTQSKSLWILNVASGQSAKLGDFPMKQYRGGDLRCDLHPRWSRDGRQICFDALETTSWTRQLHVAVPGPVNQ
jgi:hypothetical protein